MDEEKRPDETRQIDEKKAQMEVGFNMDHRCAGDIRRLFIDAIFWID